MKFIRYQTSCCCYFTLEWWVYEPVPKGCTQTGRKRGKHKPKKNLFGKISVITVTRKYIVCNSTNAGEATFSIVRIIC